MDGGRRPKGLTVNGTIIQGILEMLPKALVASMGSWTCIQTLVMPGGRTASGCHKGKIHPFKGAWLMKTEQVHFQPGCLIEASDLNIKKSRCMPFIYTDISPL